MVGTIWARWHDGTLPGRQVGWLLWQVVAEREGTPYVQVRPLWSDETEWVHVYCLTGLPTDFDIYGGDGAPMPVAEPGAKVTAPNYGRLAKRRHAK
jgi:hypothetical protein